MSSSRRIEPARLSGPDRWPAGGLDRERSRAAGPKRSILRRPAATHRIRGAFGTWIRWVGLVGAVAVAAWFDHTAADGSEPEFSAVPGGREASRLRQVGPWGELEATDLFLEPTEAFLEAAAVADQRPIWRFPGLDLSGTAERLRRCGLGDEATADLMRGAEMALDGSGVAVRLTVEQLLAVGGDVRDRLYAELGRSDSNQYHRHPQVVVGDPETTAAGLSATQRDLFRRLIWRRGGSRVFSDLPALILASGSRAEVVAAKRSFGRFQTVSATVRVPAGRESEFVDYWSAAGRSEAALPFLRSLAAAGSGRTVDAALLLPPLARLRLNTFPGLGDAIGGRMPDCNWTALNFFAPQPRFYFIEPYPSFLELTQGYDPVPRAEQLGDLVCFLGPAGEVLHSCVHVAGELVFTKNGVSPLVPWALMRFGDVAAIYRHSDAVRVQVYRRKRSRGRGKNYRLLILSRGFA